MAIKYPRVLIVGETFRLNGGGGITMTNLFRDWPPDNIGVLTDRISETNHETKYLYYQLGNEEIKFPFPLNLIQTYFPSGAYNFDAEKKQDIPLRGKHKNFLNIKKAIIPCFNNFLKYIGLDFVFYQIRISESLKKWILNFNPEIIYVQPFHHRIMRFGNLLYSELRIPYAIHIMDDSVKYVNQSIIFKIAKQKLIDKDFTKLVHNAGVRICISEAMASEYLKRYNEVFLPFRNPIETGNWIPYQKRNLSVRQDILRIIYTGRLFSPTLETLIDLCRVVDKYNSNDKDVVLDIFTHDKNISFLKIIKDLKGVIVHKPVDVKEIPQLIQQYDIFFLCLDFDMKAQKYSQFSISTRTSEGMISGVPILVYAPENSAQYQYFMKTNSGCLVGGRNLKSLESAIHRLWHDNEFREIISKNAVETALADSDAIIVREKFRKVLTIS